MRIKQAWFVILVLAMAFGLVAAAACGGEDATPVVIEREVLVEKEVIVEVEKEVVVEVEREVVVEREVIVEKEVIVEVEKTGPEITGIPRKGGVLVYGACSGASGQHANNHFATICEPGMIAMHEGLVERDWSVASPELKYVKPPPGPLGVLAESWELSDDRLTWIFHLRQGVKFHDGTDWNASVAEMNFRALIDEDYEFFYPIASAHSGYTLSNVATVRAVDEFTFEMTLNKPFFGFIDKLASYPCCSQTSGKSIETMTPVEMENGGAAGTGHFKFVSWDRGANLVLERFEDYWGENALLDQFIVTPIVEESSRVAALLTGEIDIATQLTPDNLFLIRGIEGFKGYVRGLSGFYGLEPNHRELPFSDQRVRRATSLCLDRLELSNVLMKGMLNPGAQIWGSAHEGKDPDGRQITDVYDPELGRELLAEAGYPDGFKTKMYSSSGGGMGLPELIVNNWIVISLRECGIEVELIGLEWLTYLGYWSGGINSGENIGFFTMAMGTGDVSGFDQYIHSSGWPPSGWSMGWYQNSDVDALVEKAWNATTHEEYLTTEREAHELALDDYAYIPVVEQMYTFGVSDRVGGWTGSTDWISRFNKAFVEYER